MALLLAVLSTGLLQAAPAYAKTDNDKQVYCNIEGDSGKWKAQIGGKETEHEYPLTGVFVHDENDVTAGLDAACQTQYGTVTVTPPVFTAPTCDAAGTLIGTDTQEYTFVRTGADSAAVLTATPAAGVTLSGTTVFGPYDLTQLTGEECDDETVQTPVNPIAPTVTDNCGTETDSIVLPEDSAQITYTRVGNTVTATLVNPDTYDFGAPLNGYVVSMDGLTATFTATFPDDDACEEPDACKNIDGTQTQADIDQYAPYVFVRGNGNCVITICHRTNAVVNPYNKITVSLKAVDGQGKNDHSHHLGPIFDPATMENGDDWGDIIPSNPYDTDGYNWTTEGMAVFNNGCNVPGRGGEMPEANISAAAVCTTNGVKVTLTNAGDADGSATVNGQTVNVAAGESKDVVLGFDLGTPFKTHVTVTFGDLTLIDQVVNCTPGQGGQVLGSSTTTTPTLPATLPSTGGESNPLMIVLASIIAYGAAYFLQGRRLLGRKEAFEA